MSRSDGGGTGGDTPGGTGTGGAPAGGPGPGPEGLGYEQARDELARVVAALEAGGLGLEESLALWERGEALARTCERHLAGARERVETALRSAQEDAPDGAGGRGVGPG